jgi:hypothetical protein
MLQKRRFNSIKWFWNTQISGIFTRNNCPANNTPGTVTYTVPANTHRSKISQADAIGGGGYGGGGGGAPDIYGTDRIAGDGGPGTCLIQYYGPP